MEKIFRCPNCGQKIWKTVTTFRTFEEKKFFCPKCKKMWKIEKNLKKTKKRTSYVGWSSGGVGI